MIAALAGADEVYAVGRDSAAASRKEVEEQTGYFADLARVGARVKLLSTRLQAPLATVDIVTDLPGVRPIDESIIRNVAENAAVTLMRGAAHSRPADVDVATCRRHGIAVAGVDEEAVGLTAAPLRSRSSPPCSTSVSRSPAPESWWPRRRARGALRRAGAGAPLDAACSWAPPRRPGASGFTEARRPRNSPR